MFNRPVPHGELFTGKDRRRHLITVDDELTAALQRAVDHLRQLIEHSSMPRPVHDNRCRRCSLRPGCLPETAGRRIDLFTPRPLRDTDD
ncbi:CRISPR-associated protein Cas4 [Nocardia alni]|uniref:CRISPR-associated protein Cas4 n=1 Tax=Nocardia alni TaxID=2815723 RepID=UPI0034D7B785